MSEFHKTEHLAVDIIQDNITEKTKAFGVRMIICPETQQLGVSLGTPSEITIRIIDDDRKLLFLYAIKQCQTDHELLHKFAAGELEITVFTNTTGDELSGHTIQLYFAANQDDVTYRCRINNQPFIPCEK